MELFHASQTILALDHTDEGLTDHESNTREEVFRVHKHICDLFNFVLKDARKPPDPPKGDSKVSVGLKLPKFSVPTFDGDIINWSNFWDLLSVSIHNKRELSDSEK